MKKINRFLKSVTVSLLWVSLASVSFADAVNAPESQKEKPAARQNQPPKNQKNSEKTEITTENKTADQTQSVANESGAVITDHVDPKTGKKYQEFNDGKYHEIKFSGKIKKIVRECYVDGSCLIYFDGFIVNFAPVMEGKIVKGKVYWPDEDFYKKLDSYVGRDADVYCLLEDPFILNNYPGKICTLSGSKKYFVRFH